MSTQVIYLQKAAPAPWRTQDTFQAGILNPLICFPRSPLTSLQGGTQELGPAVPRLQKKPEAARRTEDVLGLVGQATRTQGLSKASDSPPNSQQGNIISDLFEMPPINMPQTASVSHPSSSSSHSPTSIYYTQSISYQPPVSCFLSSYNLKKNHDSRKTHPHILLTAREAIPLSMALSLLYN